MPAGDLRLAGRLAPMTATGHVLRDVFGFDKPRLIGQDRSAAVNPEALQDSHQIDNGSTRHRA